MPVKKPVKKSKPAVKKAVKKAVTKSPAKPSHDEVSSKVISFIDQAADILKSGVKKTSNQTESARAATREKALTLLTHASKHLNSALEGGTSALRKGIRKL